MQIPSLYKNSTHIPIPSLYKNSADILIASLYKNPTHMPVPSSYKNPAYMQIQSWYKNSTHIPMRSLYKNPAFISKQRLYKNIDICQYHPFIKIQLIYQYQKCIKTPHKMKKKIDADFLQNKYDYSSNRISPLFHNRKFPKIIQFSTSIFVSDNSFTLSCIEIHILKKKFKTLQSESRTIILRVLFLL